MYGELCTPPPPAESLRVPTLLLHAGEFGLVREEQVDAYRAALRELVEIVEVPGGHMVYWDAYEATADALERFLDDG
jgi:pimeloyl-ACP methyl ester carboxylesterase